MLSLVIMWEPGSTRTHVDTKVKTLLYLACLEITLHVGYHAVYGISVEQQERVVVWDAVHAIQQLFLTQIRLAVSAGTHKSHNSANILETHTSRLRMLS